MSSAVAIAHDSVWKRAVGDALKALALEPLVRGKRVAVKPNETWASPKDKTAVTQPDTLKQVLQYVKKLHPRELVVSGGAGAMKTDKVMRLSGMMKVIEQEGVEFIDHNQPPYEKVELDYLPDEEVEGPQRDVMVHRRILKYETLVSLAQLKVHETATVTLSLKNIAMSFPAAEYYGYPRSTQKHKNWFFADMHSFIAAMAKRFPIQLAIIAGHPAMIGTGPIGGHTFETGLVIASTDALAADAVGARLLGFDAQGVRHIWEAARLRLGETETDRMDFPALSLEQAVEIFTQAAYGRPLSLEHA
jgi:uncharacterized protein (DUF362 family)